jgi:transposase-like protein
VVIATGITEGGGREVLGVMVGDSETEVFWTQFLVEAYRVGQRALLIAQQVDVPHHW